jgi:ketosteroid isomerase-like protein
MTRFQWAGAAGAAALAASLGACQVNTAAKPAVDTAKIADAIKADAAQLVTDLNAHDADKLASHDAADIVAMFHGAPNVNGQAADLASDKQFFTASPNTHLTLANESVDVAASGDMAVYHSTYVITVTDPKTKKPVTENGNYLAGYKPQADGSWKIEWSVVSDTGPAPAAAPAAKS